MCLLAEWRSSQTTSRGSYPVFEPSLRPRRKPSKALTVPPTRKPSMMFSELSEAQKLTTYVYFATFTDSTNSAQYVTEFICDSFIHKQLNFHSKRTEASLRVSLEASRKGRPHHKIWVQAANNQHVRYWHVRYFGKMMSNWCCCNVHYYTSKCLYCESNHYYNSC